VPGQPICQRIHNPFVEADAGSVHTASSIYDVYRRKTLQSVGRYVWQRVLDVAKLVVLE
jgi:hypothetical protein